MTQTLPTLTAYDLPGLLQQIAHLTDVETALRVAQARGGLLSTFALNPCPNNWLVKAVGMEKAKIIGAFICEDETFTRLAVPMGTVAPRASRWRRIKALVEQDVPRRQIAMLVGTDEKTVQRIKNGKRKTVEQITAQGDLVDLLTYSDTAPEAGDGVPP